MLAPKISLKQLLLGMVFLAIVLGLVSMGVRGSMVAVGLSIAILSLPVLFVFYALIYIVLSRFAAVGVIRRNSKLASRIDEKQGG